ncbi:serine hydrolase [Sphingomonas rhizophila]|uniref:beta-lactamase n=1 Tax=Sphingomonas rhizophila TaxID=2071607 RepID=A0A7G9SAH6_9SPHN|nr:serine hydrolase [Sphingomonas rhizophila]
MTSALVRRLIWLLASSGGLVGAASAAQQVDPLAPLASPPTAVPGPEALRARIREIGRSFDGKAGIAIVNLRDGWEASWNGDTLFPQQSCSKLWVAITAMDAVDKGRISLDDKVTLGRDDLTLFHQPLAAKVLGGGHTTTLNALLFTAITESDNTANDKLMRSIGGPQRVRDMIQNKGLGAIRFYEGERALQSKIAGLIWSQSYSIGDAFYKARSALPMSVRQASFNRYLSDPYDGASPHAIANALARLKKGELLSPSSTSKLLNTMGRTRTGKARVRAALAPGWHWNHKTGTGQVLNGRIGGINDIGLLTAPDGTVYAMALMSIPNKSDGAAQGMMQTVTRAVIAAHQTRVASR